MKILHPTPHPETGLPTDDISIITPTGSVPFELVCLKDVPAGFPFLIADDGDVPTDRVFREAWIADFSDPHGHGADFGVGSDHAVIGYSPEGLTFREETTGEIRTESIAIAPLEARRARPNVNIEKARDITHEKRRVSRAAEFAPLDEIIAKQLPDKSAAQAETERAAIRAKYDAMQVEIDACATPEDLKAIIEREAL